MKLGSYGELVAWKPEAPRIGMVRSCSGGWSWRSRSRWRSGSCRWRSGSCRGPEIDRASAAFLVAALIGALNAVLPPVLAALRLPFF